MYTIVIEKTKQTPVKKIKKVDDFLDSVSIRRGDEDADSESDFGFDKPLRKVNGFFLIKKNN